jgi:UDP-2-acetamido-3-amino-2,3-dideoxy-glucuronate N-acetyltransferase
MKRFIGLAGIGYWGKNILRNLYNIGVLHTICEKNKHLIEECKKLYPSLNYTTDFEALLLNKEIKAICIATPASTHYSLTRRALSCGKDVFVEKPLASTTKEGEELVQIADRENRILMVGHILQYHPAILTLKKLIREGELGKIYYIYSNRLNIGKLRVEENILWSFAPHDISMILMLTGEEPLSVSCFGESYLTEKVYDTTLTTLNFKNNLKAHIFVSWLHPFKEQKLVVVGSKAMAVFDDLTKEKLFIYPHKIDWMDGRIPVAHKAEYRVVEVEDKEPLREELIHFIECVKERKRPKTDGWEGVKVLKVLQEAERSLLSAKKIEAEYFLHPTSIVDDEVEIGKGTKIWHFSHILRGSKIGKNCIIGQNVMIGPDVEIESGCKIQNNVSIYKGVKLEKDVFCGPGCVFTNVYTPRAFVERKKEFLPTHVKRGATIGANATIICGITIGEYAFVGAHSLVNRDVPPYALVVGVPARQIGWVCKCGVSLKNFKEKMGVCGNCGASYRVEGGGLILER